jgi:hypothetical protein
MPPNLVSVEATDARLVTLGPEAGIVIEAAGRGLELPVWPAVRLMNLSPAALDAMALRAIGERIEVRVRAIVPSRAAGAGMGQDGWIGDLEITEMAYLSPNGADLAFGDIIAFEAIDSRHARHYRPGTVSVGIVAHGPSPAPGHGVGVTILLSGPADQLRLVLDERASLAPMLRALAEAAGDSPAARA